MAEALKNAAAYIRVSTDDQTEYSPDAQLNALKKYAAEHNMILLQNNIYADEGISGRKADKRPAFMKMIADAKSKEHPFDVILVHKFDRFARSREDSIVFKNLLKRDCGVSVVSITESIDDGGSGMGMLIEAISEAYAEFYSVNLSKEVKKGMTEKAKRGGLQSTPSFGYTVENHKLVPHPAEAPIIKEIYRRFLAGTGMYEIARDLNSRGIRTHRGSAFENRTIEYILRNPVYIGKLRWTPTGRTRRDFSNPDTIISDAAHSPIIDIDTWNAAQERIQEVKKMWGYKARPTSELKDWLSGIVRCAACGATLIFTKPHYFKCNGFARGGCTTSQHIHIDILHNAVIEKLNEDMELAAKPTFTVLYRDNRQTESEALAASIKILEKKKERLREAYLSGAETVEEYAAFKKKVDDEISGLKNKLAEIQAGSSKSEAENTLKNQMLNVVEVLKSPDTSKEEKNKTLRSIVERCTFDKSKMELKIFYRVFI